MKPFQRNTFGLALTVLACLIMLSVADVDAEVTEIRSQIVSTSTEFVDGQAGSTDTSVEDFPNTSSQLPIESLSGLGNFDGSAESESGARGIATFRDPSLSIVANPGEWGVEADCFSLDPSISYEVMSEITEQRDVVFTKVDLAGNPNRSAGGDAPNPSEQSSGDATVLGNVFVNGGILVWTDDPEGDLSGLNVEMVVTVSQIGGSSETAGEELFRGSVNVNGAANGEISVSTEGGLFTISDGPGLLLASNIGGIDGAVNQLEAAGNVRLVILPGQAIPYTYAARPDDPFTLEAKVSCKVNNQPGGTGVAGVFGRPFRALSSVIAPKISAESASVTQSAMNRTITQSTVPGMPDAPTARGCGAIGACMPLMLLCGLAASRRR
jgi:hypothetical protein